MRFFGRRQGRLEPEEEAPESLAAIRARLEAYKQVLDIGEPEEGDMAEGEDPGGWESGIKLHPSVAKSGGGESQTIYARFAREFHRADNAGMDTEAVFKRYVRKLTARGGWTRETAGKRLLRALKDYPEV